MKKIFRGFGVCLLAAVFLLAGAILVQRHQMVFTAESNQQPGGHAQLSDADAVLEEIESDFLELADFGKAAEYLNEKLPMIQNILENLLRTADYGRNVLCRLGRGYLSAGAGDVSGLPAGFTETFRVILPEPHTEAAGEKTVSDGEEKTEAYVPSEVAENVQGEPVIFSPAAERLRFFLLDLLEKAEKLLSQ